jgi:CheY-like chemotaxis protein
MTRPFIISIVDDDDVYRFTMRKTIEIYKLARKVLFFSDGEEALDFMNDNLGNKHNLPDVIFLDINMPVMDGFQFMEEYIQIKRKVGKQITIYMVSSSIDDADMEKAKAISEISDYIIKPIKAEGLNQIISELEAQGLLKN